MPSQRKYTRKLNFSIRARFALSLCALLFFAAAVIPFVLGLQSPEWRAANSNWVTAAAGVYAVAEGLSMGAVFALTVKVFFQLSLTTIVEIARQLVRPAAKPVSTKAGEITIRLTDMPPAGLQALIDAQTATLTQQVATVTDELNTIKLQLSDSNKLLIAEQAESARAKAELAQVRDALAKAGRQATSLEADNKTLRGRVDADARTIQVARKQVELLTGHEGNLRDGLKDLAAELAKASGPPA